MRVLTTIICFCIICFFPVAAAEAKCFDAEASDEYGKAPSPGDVCDDGSIFAGYSQDGNSPMYTTPTDLSDKAQWSSLLIRIGANSSKSGVSNAKKARTSPLYTKPPIHLVKVNAFFICENLVAYGHSDWYLPSEVELSTLFYNRRKIGGFNISGVFPSGLYWSSTEESYLSALAKDFNIGYRINLGKENYVSVRCVRKD